MIYLISWRLSGKMVIEAESVTSALEQVSNASPLQLAEVADDLEAHTITPRGEGASVEKCLLQEVPV